MDLMSKLVKVVPRRSQPDDLAAMLSTEPLTLELFYWIHRGDTSLGKETISGIECVGFRVAGHSGRHRYQEVWYAASLNFLAVRSAVYLDQIEIVTELKHIEAGKEPDAKFFRLPEGFKIVTDRH
jgi:hypothetical protein